ncbi:DNA mismatch repair endonuclease MutL [Chondromyces apiculatus]|uniref:DNA mismatch repair protein MutL n=1 Tax=Chondromyces apiculatus DSM 436 TaxID=1192034 RepID=A0A017SZK4_9BACT|nr:DNA mismatch repair endonuclease MutL [Chondromyces apiculatus]EYF02187.1 DNA mismatch repair protein MutL [Chondromyces apiculatus DSM 436]
MNAVGSGGSTRGERGAQGVKDARRVSVLPEDLANQIAAGEVVERPASVVKELVENALDAGARRIQVDIESGGVVLTRVADDGSGMAREDASLAVLRHATSKITRIDDLHAIQSFGFRGEALPSVASVSRFALRTRREVDAEGTEVRIEGGGAPKVTPCGCAVGTVVEVRDLFFNVPARRKFLRAVATESAHVTEVVQALALSEPGVTVILSREGRVAREWLRASSRAERVRAALDGEELATCAGERGPLRVEAFVSRPERARAGAGWLWLFVNGRHVRDRTLARAVGLAYGSVLEPGRYPVGAVFLDLPPTLVDVNVHPQKAEVRFADGRTVAESLQRIIAGQVAAAFGLPAPGPGGGGWGQRKQKPAAEAQGGGWSWPDRKQKPAAEAQGEGWSWSGSSNAGTESAPGDPGADEGEEKRWREGGVRAGDGPVRAGDGLVRAGDGPVRAENGLERHAAADAEGDEARGARGGSIEAGARGAPGGPAEAQGTGDPWGLGGEVQAAGPVVRAEPKAPAPVNAQLPFLALVTSGEGAQRSPASASASGAPRPQPGAPLTAYPTAGQILSATAERPTVFRGLRFAAQVRATFLVCEGADGIYFLDQHAAAERVTFHRLREGYVAREVASQKLLFPVLLQATPAEVAMVEEAQDDIARTGLEMRPAGPAQLAVHAVPRILARAAPERLARDLLDELGHAGERAFSGAVDLALATMACHGSVRAGDPMSPEEAQALLNALDEVDFAGHCPHGRPVVMRVGWGELEHRVGRR